MERTAVLVLGMHRSGTSAVAGLLAAMGLTPPSDPLPAHPDNPKGYFEPLAVMQANEAMLAEAGSAWFDLDAPDPGVRAAARTRWIEAARAALRTSFGDAPAFVLKEPRINRLADIWLAALAAEGCAVRAVVVSRAPGETAASLVKRDGMTADYAGALWLRHTRGLYAAAKTLPNVVLDYADVSAEPVGVARRLEASLPGLVQAQRGAGFIDPALRRERGEAPAGDPALFADLDAVHAALIAGDPAAFEAAARRAETHLADGAVARREFVAQWDAGRLARKAADKWKRRARKAEKAMAAADPLAAVPEAVVARIRATPLFDADWYRARYDIPAAIDPARHYLAIGAALGHDPGPLFDSDLYARQRIESGEGPGRA